MGSRVLFISPRATDAVRLGRMLRGIPVALDHAGTLAGACALLDGNSYRAVLTESKLPDAEWMEVLDTVRRMAPELQVIVTRGEVDARLWAEVLNLGAYDILAQPFAEAEVRRVLSNVCTRLPEAQPTAA